MEHRRQGAPGCPLGIAPEDVAAWTLDGHTLADVDLGDHVERCAACRDVIGSLAPLAGVPGLLRGVEGAQAGRVGERAIRRVRAEATAALFARTLAGAFLRVARALPDYLGGEGAGGPRSP